MCQIDKQQHLWKEWKIIKSIQYPSSQPRTYFLNAEGFATRCNLWHRWSMPPSGPPSAPAWKNRSVAVRPPIRVPACLLDFQGPTCPPPLYRGRQKSVSRVWWILLLLLLTTSASNCLENSCNLGSTLVAIHVSIFPPFLTPIMPSATWRRLHYNCQWIKMTSPEKVLHTFTHLTLVVSETASSGVWCLFTPNIEEACG